MAKFAYDANSFPAFAIPDSGSSILIDSGRVNGNISWTDAASGFASALLGGEASRQRQQSWTLKPVTHPAKLELMRFAYQRAVAGCSQVEAIADCPNCAALEKKFVDAPDGPTKPNCLGSCWFGMGCKKCVPKHCGCELVGHHCGLYVWVLPGQRDQLTKLTLQILDYALYSPSPGRTKEVTWYLDATNQPVTEAQATRIVRAVVPFDTPTNTVPLNADAPPNAAPQSEAPIFDRPELRRLPPVLDVQPGINYLQLQQNLRALTPEAPSLASRRQSRETGRVQFKRHCGLQLPKCVGYCLTSAVRATVRQ